MKNFKISSTIISSPSKEGDSVLICDLDNDSDIILKIENVAIHFWTMIQEDKTEEEIIASILDEYDGCDKASVSADLSSFINDLKTHNIILKN